MLAKARSYVSRCQVSDSLCCPSPNYCCPNSVSSCADPGAVLYDANQTAVTKEIILHHWPLFQNRPFRWEMTPRTAHYVAQVWDEGIKEVSSPGVAKLQSADELDSIRRGRRRAAQAVERDIRIEATLDVSKDALTQRARGLYTQRARV